MHILLADDHLLFREALITFIEAIQPEWTVMTASDVAEALALVADHNFDLVLLDLRMPGMGNLEGIKMIRDECPDLPLAVLSGVAAESQVREVTKMGVRAYFPKTLSGKALVKAIDLVVYSNQRFVPMDETGLQIMPAYYDGNTLSHAVNG